MLPKRTNQMSSATPSTMPTRPVLLIGSVPWKSASQVFEAVGQHLGSLAPCIPDGDQAGWIAAIWGTFPNVEGLEPSRQIAMHERIPVKLQLFRLKDGFKIQNLKLGPFHFATTAARSYEDFKRLRSEGKIPKGTRFQVSLPSPMAGSGPIEAPVEERLPLMEAAMLREINHILSTIPAADLAFQWDCIEPELDESLRRPEAMPPLFREMGNLWTLEQATASIARMCNHIPVDVKVGVHLCYGDPGGRHVIEPVDAAVLVDIANGIAKNLQRPLNWIHLPVPIERDDPAYFAPLKNLKLQRDTQLYLGLVHQEDGVEGARRRIRAAKEFVTNDFGVATECGFSALPPDTIPAVLDLHREVAHIV